MQLHTVRTRHVTSHWPGCTAHNAMTGRCQTLGQKSARPPSYLDPENRHDLPSSHPGSVLPFMQFTWFKHIYIYTCVCVCVSLSCTFLKPQKNARHAVCQSCCPCCFLKCVSCCETALQNQVHALCEHKGTHTGRQPDGQIYTHTHTHTHTHIHTHTLTYIFTHTHTHTHTQNDIHMYTHTHTHTHTEWYLHLHTHTHTHIPCPQAQLHPHTHCTWHAAFLVEPLHTACSTQSTDPAELALHNLHAHTKTVSETL